MDDYIIAGLIGISVFLVGSIIVALINETYFFICITCSSSVIGGSIFAIKSPLFGKKKEWIYHS